MKLEIINNPCEEIQKGDYVRVTREALSYENGWESSWNECMTFSVGKLFKVKRVDPNNIYTKIPQFQLEDGWYYPIFVLKKIYQP